MKASQDHCQMKSEMTSYNSGTSLCLIEIRLNQTFSVCAL